MKTLIYLSLLIIPAKLFSQNNVGIGTATPQSSTTLHVDMGTSQTKGFLVSGNSTGAHYFPILGAGKRMMFYPAHGSFRAGIVTGNHWDDLNAGYYSAAFGNDVIARGTGSFATGFKSIAHGNFSNALGLYSIAKGICLTVVGMYNDSLVAADPGVATAASPLFIVGNGDLNSNSNAFMVRKDGKVAIGNFTPDYLLDIGNRMRIRSGGDVLSSPGIWFNNINNSSTAAFVGMINDNHVGFFGGAGGGWQFSVNTSNGNVGIGHATPLHKLDVDGSINFTGEFKMSNNSGTAGQVLTSNGLAAPSWQSVANPRIGFYARITSGQTIPWLGAGTVAFNQTEFNDGNAFNTSTHQFVTPSPGVYHFDATISWSEQMDGVTTYISYYKNAVEMFRTIYEGHRTGSSSFTTYLNEFDRITIVVYNGAGISKTVSAGDVNRSFFSGFKVY